MLKRIIKQSFVTLIVFCSIPAFAENKPILAVFEIEDRGAGLSAELRSELTDYMSVLLVEGGFQVIPREQIKNRLASLKDESYQNCYDQKCQIELGRELAAQNSLVSQIMKIGEVCRVTTTLYDLKMAAASKAASAKVECSETELCRALEEVVFKLTEGKGGTMRTKVSRVEPRTSDVPPMSSIISQKVETSSSGYATWGHVSFWSGVGCAAFGVASLFIAQNAGDQYNHTGNSSDFDDTRLWSGGMWSGFALGTSLMATGIILWLSEPSKSRRETKVLATAWPSLDGSGFGMTMSWGW